MTDMNSTAIIFETALTSEKPVRALLDMAEAYLEKEMLPENEERTEAFQDIDAMLNGLFVKYVQRGTGEDFEHFIDDILAFVDSKKGDTLKELSGCERFYYRWDHFHDLCTVVLENYDASFTERFITSRKHGPELMEILFANPDGIRHNVLATTLRISPQHLSKLLRELGGHGLINIEKRKGAAFVKHSFIGRVHMSGKKDSEEMEVNNASTALPSMDTEEMKWVIHIPRMVPRPAGLLNSSSESLLNTGAGG
jgi:hypothetical protein